MRVFAVMFDGCRRCAMLMPCARPDLMHYARCAAQPSFAMSLNMLTIAGSSARQRHRVAMRPEVLRFRFAIVLFSVP